MQSISAEGAIHWLMKVLTPLMKTGKKTSGYIIRSAAFVFLFVSSVVTLILAVESHAGPNLVATPLWGVNPDVPQARGYTLTFADRLAYQRAIEEVYWRHRIWPNERHEPKPSLELPI